MQYNTIRVNTDHQWGLRIILAERPYEQFDPDIRILGLKIRIHSRSIKDGHTYILFQGQSGLNAVAMRKDTQTSSGANLPLPDTIKFDLPPNTIRVKPPRMYQKKEQKLVFALKIKKKNTKKFFGPNLPPPPIHLSLIYPPIQLGLKGL